VEGQKPPTQTVEKDHSSFPRVKDENKKKKTSFGIVSKNFSLVFFGYPHGS
jgi:hypothetical protein